MNGKRTAVSAIVSSCIAISCVGSLVFGYPGIMAPHWRSALGVSRGAVGASLFFMLAALGTFMFVAGRWQQRFGPRRLVFAGEALTSVSLLVAAYLPGLPAVYLWAFLAGAASCFVYIPTLTVAQLWWPMRRGFASGLISFAFAVSAAVLVPVFGWLFRAVGYRGANLVLAAVVLAIGGAASHFTVSPPPKSAVPQDPTARSNEPRSLTVRQSTESLGFWCLWLVWALQGAAGVSMITLSGFLGVSKGFSPPSLAWLLMVFNLNNGFSRLIMGYLSDLVGRRASMAVPFLAAGAAYFALPHADGLASVAMLVALVGFAFGTLFAVSAPLALDCFGPAHFGAVFGLVFTAYGYVSGIIGPWLSGVLLDRSAGDPTIACIYLGTFCLLSALLVRWVQAPTPGAPA